MNKAIVASGAGAVKTILKNKDALNCSLKNKIEGNGEVTYVFDFFYDTVSGTLNFRWMNDEVQIANLDLLGVKKVITLDTDANLKKLCKYVLETYGEKK